MPQRAILLQISQPCAERWDAMTPTGPGRHCLACQKTVVDFTQKTDAEILAALRQAAGQTCGRLRADQLARPLVPATQPNRWRNWLGAILAVGGVLGSSRVTAQTRGSYYAGPLPAASSAATSPQPDRATAPAAPEATASGGLTTIRGTVTDSATHEGLPGVTVLVKGTDIGVSTDTKGAFELAIPSGVAAPALLTFSAIGFISQERAAEASQPLTVALATDTLVLGGISMGIVITGVPPLQRPWPWHPRRFFNWSKYWLARPFRG